MKIGRYFAGAAILLLPFVFSPGAEEIRQPKANYLAALFGLWLCTELWRKVHPALGGAGALIFLYALFRAVSFPLPQILAVTAALGSCLWVAQPRKDDIKRGLEILEISGVLVACYALVFQLAGKGFFLKLMPGAPPSAVFGQHTLYGPFAVACFASALFSGRHFRALLLFLPIPIISSSFTYLALGVVLFLYALMRFGRRALLGTLLMAVTVLSVSKFQPSLTKELLDDKNRFVLWRQVYWLAERQMLLGHGFASFRIIYPIFQDPEMRRLNGIEVEKQSKEVQMLFRDATLLKGWNGLFLHPHNEPLSVFFEFGVLGLLFAAWWVLSFVWQWLQVPDDSHNWALAAIFFSFLANALGNFPFHLIPQVLLPLWAYVAVTSQKQEGILEQDATH